MSKIQLLFSSLGISLLATSAFLVQRNNVQNPHFTKVSQEYSKEEAKEIAGAVEYYRLTRANQITGEIDPEAVRAAREQTQTMFDPSFKKTRGFSQMDWSETGPSNVGGRTRIVVPDRTVPNKLYMGAVGGGFWMSTDGGSNWTKRSGNDSSVAISVSSIAQTSNGDIYYGTGEGQSGFAGSATFVEQPFQLGEGIFKSTDGGATFTQLASTKPSNSNSSSDAWSYVNKIVAHPSDPNKLFAATYGGLKMTTDGGVTWVKPSTLSVTAHFLDVEISSDGNTIVASTRNAIYISKDGGTTFSSNKVGVGGVLPSSVSNRIEVAIAPNDPNYVYAVFSSNASTLQGVYKSIDGGDTWSILTLGGGVFEPLGGQGNYNIAFAVHPLNKELLYLGGNFSLYRYTNALGWQAIAYWSGSAFAGDLVHADMHCVTFDPVNSETMYVCTDGGFYRTFNATASNPVFGEKNKNYNVTQCYGIAANYLGRIIFGTQDNGSGLIGEAANSSTESRDLTGGDGTRCAMSDFQPNFVFTSIIYGTLRRATDGGQANASFAKFFDENIDKNADGSPEEKAGWVAPILFRERMVVGSTYYESVNGFESSNAAHDNSVVPELRSIMLFGTAASVWMTQDALKGNPVWFKLFSPGGLPVFTALTMSKDGKTIFAGTGSGVVYRIKVPSMWNIPYKYSDTITNLAASGFPNGAYITSSAIANYSRYVTDLSCDSTGNVLLVTLGNYSNNSYVYKSVNAIDSLAPVFTDITSNLPKMPVYSAVNVGDGPSKFILGTELGLWGSDNGGSSWTELNMMSSDETKWHPRVATYEVIEKNEFAQADANGGGYRKSIIYSGTHGRGTFRSTSLSTYFPTSVSFQNELTETIHIYPNPAIDQVNVEYDAKESSIIQLKVYSLTGSLVKETSVHGNYGKNLIPINVSNLVPGGYIVYMNCNGKKASSTLIKK